MYDFTTMLDRTASDAIAVQVVPVKGVEVREGFSKIPMWVAETNTLTPSSAGRPNATGSRASPRT